MYDAVLLAIPNQDHGSTGSHAPTWVVVAIAAVIVAIGIAMFVMKRRS